MNPQTTAISTIARRKSASAIRFEPTEVRGAARPQSPVSREAGEEKKKRVEGEQVIREGVDFADRDHDPDQAMTVRQTPTMPAETVKM